MRLKIDKVALRHRPFPATFRQSPMTAPRGAISVRAAGGSHHDRTIALFQATTGIKLSSAAVSQVSSTRARQVPNEDCRPNDRRGSEARRRSAAHDLPTRLQNSV